MLSSDKNVENIRQLFVQTKEYVELKGHSAQLTLIDKLTVGLSAFVLGAVVFVLASLIILFLSAMCAILLAPHVGGAAIACAIIAFIYFLLAVLAYLKRRSWIVNPIANFIAHLVLDARNKVTGKENSL